MVTLIHSSLLSGNVLTGNSSAADRRAAECGYLNSLQLTERERAHWTYLPAVLEGAKHFTHGELTVTC